MVTHDLTTQFFQKKNPPRYIYFCREMWYIEISFIIIRKECHYEENTGMSGDG